MSDCCSTKSCSCGMILTATLIAAGVAGLVWLLLAHGEKAAEYADPLSETERRINALEDSLHHLQDSVGQAVGS